MTANNRSEILYERLFADAEVNVFAILDGASVPDLLPHLDTFEPDYVCLYRGELEPDMEEVAPYLVAVEPDSEFADWLIQAGWGNHWGIFVLSEADLATLRRHFRKFLIVHDSDGKPLYFRYYDPRVLRIYLPTCNAKELETVFGPVEQYILESEDPALALRFRAPSAALQQERVPLDGREAAPNQGT